jgi:colanic acid biosynthesis glycosyl transferase WcaI
MKILIYSANFAPEPTGIGKYSGEMAAWLAAHGHEVRAVAAPPYYPSWQVSPEYRWPPYRVERWQGVSVWRAPLWVPKSPRGLTRVLHLLSFAVTSFPIMLRHIFWRPDLVLVVAPAFVCAPAALLTARLSRAKVWLHMQDFEIDIAFSMNLLKGAFLRRVFLRVEREVLKRFDSVSSISGRMVNRLLEKGVPPDRVSFFPNWVDMSHIRPTDKPGNYRAQFGIDQNAFVVLFSGTLGSKQGLLVLPAAARLLAQRQDIVFVICGEGVMKPALEAACADLPNTRIFPLQPVDQLGNLLCMADVHVLPQSFEAEDLVLPSKLSGMLASGKPVIATCHAKTELDALVSTCGLVVEPEDSAAMANAIARLADDADLRTHLGRCARMYAALHFERESVLQRIFGHLEGEEGDVEMRSEATTIQNDVVRS